MADFLSIVAIPVIQAPMAGGITTPELVAAVVNAGAIGSFGFAYTNAEGIDAQLSEIMPLINGSSLCQINANFFIFPEVEVPSNKDYEAALEVLQNLPFTENPYSTDEYALPAPPYFPSLEQQLEPIWKHKPGLLTFHFGLPSAEIVQKAHTLGICVGVTATCVEEAVAIQNLGVDFVVAQGIEAGGHRGNFSAPSHGNNYSDRSIQNNDDAGQSTMDLLKDMRQSITIPIVCAGGVMTGRGISNLIGEGAAAVQMGTAFLCCNEAGTSKVHKEYILTQHLRKTVYTKGFSGRWAQAMETEFTSYMQAKPVLQFPLQNTLTGKMRKAASLTADAMANGAANGEFQSLYAGSNFTQARAMPVEQLIAALVAEMNCEK